MISTPNATAHPATGWRGLVEKSWPAILAGDLLRKGDKVWHAEGLNPPKSEETIALAAMGRLFRFRQSVLINLPLSRESTLPRLAFYLHRLRLDAGGGLIRSTWLNPVTVASRNDLIVFGRPRRLMREFSTSSMMRPVVFDACRPIGKSSFQRTLLVSGHGDVLETLTELSGTAMPFAIVVQLTQQGCDAAGISIIKVLPDFFPDVPIIALGYTGQTLSEPLPLHVWSMRVGDVVAGRHAIGQPVDYSHRIEVVAATDPVMDSFIKKLSLMNWNLKNKLATVGGSSIEMEALIAIERTLRCLNVPLAVHEDGMARHLHGGKFAVRTIESWLAIAERLRGRRGDIQELHEQLMTFVRAIVKDLLQAKTGRGELLNKLCSEAMNQSQHTSVLVGNIRDAEILQHYIERRLGASAVEYITVSYMDGAMAVPPEMTDLVIYAGPLFPSRIHWLGLASKRKLVLCHPFEHERVCQTISRWWHDYGLPSHPNGDKHRLWSFDWLDGQHVSDTLIDNDEAFDGTIPYLTANCDGEYPRHTRVVQIVPQRGYEDWLDALLADPAPSPLNEEVAPGPARDLLIIYLEGDPEPVRWPASRQVLRLQKQEVDVCTANELVAGNEIILLVSSEERVATQRELFDMFVRDSHGLSQYLRVADKWQQLVDDAVRKCGSAVELNRFLRTKRYEVHNVTVRNWADGGVIGPQDPAVIPILTELLKVPGAAPVANMIANAIKAVRSEHQRIGFDLRRAITASRNRDVSVVQIGSRAFTRDVFDAMVQIGKVVRIDRPPINQSAAAQPRTIKEVANEFLEQNGERIAFTSACERSMARSGFADLKAFRRILKVLAEGFYPLHASHTKSMKDVEDMLAEIPASYASGMSLVTKGKFEQHYYRLYQGQKVDISPHIKLGRTHDPRYTLRLHFHWDAERSLIIVHHAGEHLPTQSD